jgi:hypothetical protein
MKKFIFLIVFVLFASLVFGAKLITLTDINAPERIVVDKDRIFIAELTTIFVYSKDGKLQKTFGKKGEGPGEFIATTQTGGLGLDILPDMLMVTSVGKVSFFSKDGEFKRVVKAPRGIAAYKPLDAKGEHFCGMGFALDEGVLYATINLYDGQLQKEKEIHRQKNPFQPGKSMNPFLTPPMPYVDNGTIVVDTRLGNFLVFNDKGEKLADIQHKWDKIELDKEYQDKVWDYYKNNPRVKANFERIKNLIVMPDNLPNVKMCSVDNQKIYALTYVRKDNKAEFYVFDFNGKLLKHAFVEFAFRNLLKAYPYTVHNDVLYYIAEDIEKEEWSLYTSEIK